MDDYYESLCKYDDESVKKYMIEDFDFTTWYVYNKESSLCKFAVSIFIFNNLINEKLILKHEPFDIWTFPASVWTYDDLISRFDFLKYSVAKAVIMLKYDIIYFHNDFPSGSCLGLLQNITIKMSISINYGKLKSMAASLKS